MKPRRVINLADVAANMAPTASNLIALQSLVARDIEVQRARRAARAWDVGDEDAFETDAPDL